MSLFWDFYFGPGSPWDRQRDGGGHDDATPAGDEARRTAKSVEELRKETDEKIDRLALICRALWELLRDSGSLSEEALLEKVREVDLRDGALDGRVRTPPQKCSQCGRTVSRRHRRCIYCGAEGLIDTAFDAL
jgi:hypothetical protein